MLRIEKLRLLLNQAQFNGFEFRRWFVTHVQPTWLGSEQALSLLAGEGRFYTLLFSHEFAQCFWRSGAQMAFVVPGISYPRVNAQGQVVQVTRKPFTKRTIKPDVWKYHIRQMALADDPIDYLCRFLPVQDWTKSAQTSPEPLVAQA